MRRGGVRLRLVAATLVAVGIGGFVWSGAATAAGKTGTITVTPDTGLTSGATVTIAGTGFTSPSIGNIVYCNNAPNEPTVNLPQPVGAPLAIGCVAPGYAANGLVGTINADGTFSKTYTVASGTIGPPCGTATAIIKTCPTDSAGQNAATDAANYPCPPTPAQQAAGVTCTLQFGDQAGDTSNSVSILFTGESPPSSTTTTAAAAPTTTAAPATTVATTPATTPVTAAPVSSPSNSLATTGPGPQLWWTALGASALVATGLFLWLVSLGTTRRRAPRPSG